MLGAAPEHQPHVFLPALQPQDEQADGHDRRQQQEGEDAREDHQQQEAKSRPGHRGGDSGQRVLIGPQDPLEFRARQLLLGPAGPALLGHGGVPLQAHAVIDGREPHHAVAVDTIGEVRRPDLQVHQHLMPVRPRPRRAEATLATQQFPKSCRMRT